MRKSDYVTSFNLRVVGKSADLMRKTFNSFNDLAKRESVKHGKISQSKDKIFAKSDVLHTGCLLEFVHFYVGAKG